MVVPLCFQLMYNQLSIKPRKIFLNYNFTKREYQGNLSTNTRQASLTNSSQVYEKPVKAHTQIRQLAPEYHVVPQIQLPKIQPIFNSVQVSRRQSLSCHYTESAPVIVDHLGQAEIANIKLKYPKVSIPFIYTYFTDYKSLNQLNKGRGVLLVHFKRLCVTLNYHSEKEIARIFEAIGVGLQAVLEWDKFLQLRILMDDCGTPDQIIDFIYNYFESNNGIVEECTVIYMIQCIGKRIEQFQKKKRSDNDYSDRFTIMIVHWMRGTNQLMDGELQKVKMREEYEKSEYLFTFLLNCILGGYQSGLFSWMKKQQL